MTTPTPTDGSGRTFDPAKHLANADGSPKIKPDGLFIPRSPGRYHKQPDPVSALRFRVVLAMGSGGDVLTAAFSDFGDAREFASVKRKTLGAAVTARVFAGCPERGGELLEEFPAATPKPASAAGRGEVTS